MSSEESRPVSDFLITRIMINGCIGLQFTFDDVLQVLDDQAQFISNQDSFGRRRRSVRQNKNDEF